MEERRQINQIVDHLFRHEAGKMTSVLARLLGFENLELAQDIVQDSLLKAMTTWRYGKIPHNPAGWLYRVAKNKAIDHIRKEKTFNRISPEYARLMDSEYSMAGTIDQLFMEHEIKDSQLRMIFAACHPVIPPESQIAFTLKTLCGLSNQEIARAFLTQEETITKRIYRAREKIRHEQIDLSFPVSKIQLAERMEAVLSSLYLLFNEGYNSAGPDQLIREELCNEAIRLTTLLSENNPTDSSKPQALLSLMYFQASRLRSRLNEKGQIVVLRHQDRRSWNRQFIQRGFDALNKATENSELSTYHIEAAIASIHASSESFEKTDWTSIYHLYQALYEIHPSPVVALNKAIASAYAIGREKALKELQSIRGLEKHYLYYASLGEMYFDLDQKELARENFEKALSLTTSVAEQEHLQLKIYFCRD